MDFVNSNIKTFLIIAILTFFIIVILAAIGNYIDPTVTDPALREKLGYVSKIVFFLLVVILALVSMPLIPYFVTNLFLHINKSAYWVNVVREHQLNIIKYYTYSCWVIIVSGLVIVFSFIGNIFKKF
jgi:hypothetical protein